MNIAKSAIAAIAFLMPVLALAQTDKPGAVATASVEAVVVVQSVDRQARTVVLKGPRAMNSRCRCRRRRRTWTR